MTRAASTRLGGTWTNRDAASRWQRRKRSCGRDSLGRGAIPFIVPRPTTCLGARDKRRARRGHTIEDRESCGVWQRAYARCVLLEPSWKRRPRAGLSCRRTPSVGRVERRSFRRRRWRCSRFVSRGTRGRSHLLVLWRGSPGWLYRGGATRGGGSESPTISSERGDVKVEVSMNAATRQIWVQGKPHQLGSANVILVGVPRTRTSSNPQKTITCGSGYRMW
jgi:hypothetical protein